MDSLPPSKIELLDVDYLLFYANKNNKILKKQ
jgi:hypothetical protein